MIEMIVNRIDQLIGNTPVVKLNMEDPNAADVYVKLEFFNPGGSVKDRIAKKMIESAEEQGKLKPGDTIIEPTSGNTGIGVAMVGASKGYHVILTMPDTMSMERRNILNAYGAKLVLTEGAKGMKGAIEKATELQQANGYYMLRQFDNENNVKAHEETTALEILHDFKDGLDVFVSGIGTGGTITGVGKVLKSKLNNIRLVAVEPSDSPVLSGGKPGPHKIQGIGAGFVPSILKTDLYDEVRTVSNDEAFALTRELAKHQGLFLGGSSGAAIKIAMDVAKEIGKGKKVLVIAPDNGERYLSTPIYQTGE
jgi:cysteine synthase